MIGNYNYIEHYILTETVCISDSSQQLKYSAFQGTDLPAARNATSLVFLLWLNHSTSRNSFCSAKPVTAFLAFGVERQNESAWLLLPLQNTCSSSSSGKSLFYVTFRHKWYFKWHCNTLKRCSQLMKWMMYRWWCEDGGDRAWWVIESVFLRSPDKGFWACLGDLPPDILGSDSPQSNNRKDNSL